MKANIVLIGMPGSGKTSVGKKLAEKLNLIFLDLDAAIEEAVGKPISVIFSEEGEESFRQWETACAVKASEGSGQVIATGGGIILREENMKALRKTGTIVFLDRSVKEICGSDLSGRPLIGSDPDRVQVFYDQRIGLYQKYAEVTAGSHEAPEKVAEALAAELLKA